MRSDVYKVEFLSEKPIEQIRSALRSVEAFDVSIKRRTSKASSKGGRFERLFCKKISLWLSHGAEEYILWRTRGSGGWATRTGATYQLGDVSVTPEFVMEYGWFNRAVFELRNRDIEPHRLLTTLTTWYIQHASKLPSIQDYFPLVVLNAKGTWLTICDQSIADHFDFPIFWINSTAQLTVFSFESFVNLCTPASFRSFLEWRCSGELY